MEQEDDYALPHSSKSQPKRVICVRCGKLLFKLETLDLEKPAPLPSYILEIKCYNHACKTMNVVKI